MTEAAHSQERPAGRRATNVTLSQDLLREARALEVNVSQACERGLADEVGRRRAQAWLAQNGPAVEEWNAHVAAFGVPLRAFRQF